MELFVLLAGFLILWGVCWLLIACVMSGDKAHSRAVPASEGKTPQIGGGVLFYPTDGELVARFRDGQSCEHNWSTLVHDEECGIIHTSAQWQASPDAEGALSFEVDGQKRVVSISQVAPAAPKGGPFIQNGELFYMDEDGTSTQITDSRVLTPLPGEPLVPELLNSIFELDAIEDDE